MTASPTLTSQTSYDKILPPLPHDMMGPHQPGRPTTLYANKDEALSQGDLLAPQAPFRSEQRRQSFNGVANRGNPSSWTQTAPMNGNGLQRPPSFAARYNEFGASQQSLGSGRAEGPPSRFDDDESTMSKRGSKTRSRFGISSLFSTNKKPQQNVPPMLHLGTSSSATLAPGPRPSDVHHARDYSLSHSSFSEAGNARSMGTHSARASVTSTKKLALIPQEEDFVAYRYPSNSQTLPNYR